MNVVFADQIDGGREEAAGAGGGVEDFFAELGRAHLGHELGDGARGVVFALVPGVSQFDEDGLVNGAENVTVVGVVEVEAVELIDDFAHLEAATSCSCSSRRRLRARWRRVAGLSPIAVP